MEPKLEFSRKFTRAGVLLLLLGLLTGLAIPAMQNPRMGLSSHLEAMLNGMLLIIFGLIWPKLRLSERARLWGYRLALFGAFTNWLTTFLAGIWGAGANMMPIAGGEQIGSAIQEGIITFGLASLTIAMLTVTGMALWGLRGAQPAAAELTAEL